MNRLVAPSIEISRTAPSSAGLRQPHEPLDAVRHADERVHRLAVLGAGKLQRDREAEIGNERERDAPDRSASGVSSGKMWARK